MGDKSFVILFQRVYQLPTLQEAPTTTFHLAFGRSWNLHLHRHPLEWEVEVVSSLISVLDFVIMTIMGDMRV